MRYALSRYRSIAESNKVEYYDRLAVIPNIPARIIFVVVVDKGHKVTLVPHNHFFPVAINE